MSLFPFIFLSFIFNFFFSFLVDIVWFLCQRLSSLLNIYQWICALAFWSFCEQKNEEKCGDRRTSEAGENQSKTKMKKKRERLEKFKPDRNMCECVQQQFKEVGDALEVERVSQMTEQLGLFKENLEEFAKKYRKEIAKSPEFRTQFQKMCAQIGVDPLACKHSPLILKGG